MGYEVPTRIVVVVGYPREVYKEGGVVADGTEQLVVEVPGIVSLEGYIDLSAMASGDTVVIKRYVRIEDGGEYRLHASETYIGVQEEPLVRFPPMVSYYGMKITLQQTGGVYRRFPYQFFKV